MKYDKAFKEPTVVKDGIVLEKKPAATKQAKSADNHAKNAKQTYKIDVADVLDTLMGYINPYFGIGADVGGNTCKLCGEPTNSEPRKLCVDCMKEYGLDIYRAAVDAVKDGKVTFTFKK